MKKKKDNTDTLLIILGGVVGLVAIGFVTCAGLVGYGLYRAPIVRQEYEAEVARQKAEWDAKVEEVAERRKQEMHEETRARQEREAAAAAAAAASEEQASEPEPASAPAAAPEKTQPKNDPQPEKSGSSSSNSKTSSSSNKKTSSGSSSSSKKSSSSSSSGVQLSPKDPVQSAPSSSKPSGTGSGAQSSGVSVAEGNGDTSRTVYVSNRSNTIHSISDCSGMKNYREMTKNEADSNNYEYCKNCW